MKKDRNTFFESSQVTSSFMPNPAMNAGMNFPNQMMQNQMMPYQSSTNSSSFYAGPNMPMNTYPGTYDNNDLENKVSRLERQVQKLESRISKLESSVLKTSDDDINITSNMYMI